MYISSYSTGFFSIFSLRMRIFSIAAIIFLHQFILLLSLFDGALPYNWEFFRGSLYKNIQPPVWNQHDILKTCFTDMYIHITTGSAFSATLSFLGTSFWSSAGLTTLKKLPAFTRRIFSRCSPPWASCADLGVVLRERVFYSGYPKNPHLHTPPYSFK